MSTKIYNGYCIESCSLEEFAEKYMPKIREKLTEKLKEDLTNCLANLWEAAAYGTCDFWEEIKSKKKGRLIGVVLEGFEVLQKEESPVYDFKVNIAIKSFQGNIYLGWFGSRALRESFDKIKGIKEYSYWNNSDAMEGVSNKKWKERAEIWNAVLGVKSWDEANFMSVSVLDKEHVQSLMYECVEKAKDLCAKQAMSEDNLLIKWLDECVVRVNGEWIGSKDINKIINQILANEGLKAEIGAIKEYLKVNLVDFKKDVYELKVPNINSEQLNKMSEGLLSNIKVLLNKPQESKVASPRGFK